jgi:hypothetical protein
VPRCSLAANIARLTPYALACNLGNFLRKLATPEPTKDGSLTNVTAVLRANVGSTNLA